ncbi:uncharacterized protein LOC107261195 [Ricinus communis]|uniref:uncharacterized protein LOC107261195 n=1 Tax=Ricinus communis TaxID=3988 RepID=UPI0007721691|nr:uncharacterized protein LOC107261195 [Ricinus communis]|eukprot:XP_015574160.1 uncharacterized protein LOC107261195 [Ricinus communis]
MASSVKFHRVTKAKAQVMMEEMHKEVCGPHMNGIVLTRKIICQGYYWLTMEKDCIALVRKYHECQLYNDLSHVPPSEVHNLTSPWPFIAWGIDIIGEIKSPLNGHRYIVVVIDFFSNWVKAKSFTTVGARQMAKFIERNLIYRYGVPHHVVTDNGVQFMGKTANLLAKYKIEHHRSSLYRPKANGAAEADKKKLKKILLMMVGITRIVILVTLCTLGISND